MSNRNFPPRNRDRNEDSQRPLPQEIYVRRRIAALIAILVVVALLIWGLSSLVGGNNDSEQAAVTAPPTTLAESSETLDIETSTSEKETPSDSKDKETSGEESPYPGEGSEDKKPRRDEEPAPEGKDSCNLQDLRITATADRSTYRGDAKPTFYMTVENPTSKDCKIDLDKEELRFEVYDLATNARVWSDVDCYPPVETGRQTFKAGDKRHFEAVWSRLSSAPEQCNGRQPVGPGSYFVHAVIGDNPSPAATFNIGA